LGIGVLDDVIEVITIIVLTMLLGTTVGHAQSKISITIVVLLGLFATAYLLTKLKHKATNMKFKGISSFFYL